jgi:hypothetical protein
MNAIERTILIHRQHDILFSFYLINFICTLSDFMKNLLLTFTLFVFSFTAHAQGFTELTVQNGSQTLPYTIVSTLPNSLGYCASPYAPACTFDYCSRSNATRRFDFSQPVYRIRLAIDNAGLDTMAIKLNGVTRNILPSEISFVPACHPAVNNCAPVIVNGYKLTATLPFVSGMMVNLDLVSLTPIYSFEAEGFAATAPVNETSHFDIFVYDFGVKIDPAFSLNNICPGATFQLPYTTAGTFSAGNVFTAQLSNGLGNFTAPVNIGSVTATGSGTIQCTIPENTLAGGSYRLRIVSSAPSYTSFDNGINIAIRANAGKPVATSNAPVCDTKNLSLFSTTAANTTYSWSGPNSFSAATVNTSRSNMQLSDAGNYIVTATYGPTGCQSKDTVAVVVKPTPTTPVASTGGPVCSGSALNLFANSSAGATYAWTGPFPGSTTQNPVINNAQVSNSGTYSVTATLDGCTSLAGTTTAQVKPMPSVPVTSYNGPLCQGNTLQLNASSTAGSSYSWSGPMALPLHCKILLWGL